MDRVAVDIVLLPDRSTTELAVDLNRELVAQYSSPIVLEETMCRPHVSLAMGCLRLADVEVVSQRMETIANENPMGEILISGIVTTLNAEGQHISSLALVKTREIQALHERVTNEMAPYIGYDVTPEMIYDDGPVAETTLTWIRTFREKSSFGAFFPHITLGYGMVATQLTFPMHATAAQLALCHLGNHCTCRKVLFQTSVPLSRTVHPPVNER